MNKRIVPFALLAALLLALLAGCVVTSVHPFYTSKDIVFEPSLIGQWTNIQSSTELWTFAKEGRDSYRLNYVSDGKTNLCRACFFKLNSSTFIDVAAFDQDSEIIPPPIPSHFLLRVTQLSPTVRMAVLNNDWLRTLLDKEPKALGHTMIGEKADDRRVVLTAETAELQAFLSKHLATADAWSDPLELKRTSAR